MQMSYSTVTAAAHPMTFWSLTTLAPTATSLTYSSPLTAIRIPPASHQHRDEMGVAMINSDKGFCITLVSSPTLRVPTASSGTISPSVTSTLCSVIKGSYPESTLPAFCRPTLFVNAPSFASLVGAQAALPTAVVTMGSNSVPDKVSCCAECANYYNCYAWRFVPSYTGQASDRLPGGFDPFRRGNCEIAYYGGNTTEHGVTIENAASVCPNGRLEHMLSGSNNVDRQDPWVTGLYYNGWNEGACGNAGNIIFTQGHDKGYGDEALCSAQRVWITV
ncbi:hypothetical protein GGS20DRAFT_568539 [Poronia punctata]|nr:hypothetical protein GGS20DRAFT_568539 [Poronia punctata]